MKFIKKIPIKNNTKKTELKVLYYEQNAKNTRTPKPPKPITKKKTLLPKEARSLLFQALSEFLQQLAMPHKAAGYQPT